MPALVYEHDYMRAEFDWLALDRSGQVGFFASGGFGPVPPQSLRDADYLVGLHDAIRELPKSCAATLVADVEYYVRDFVEVAERGIHAYNWDFEGHSYRLIARPGATMDPAEGRQVMSVARRVRLPLTFDSASWIAPTIEVEGDTPRK
jgi:hypothetical protein